MTGAAEIRPARPEDALPVAGVHVRSWQAGYRGLLPEAYLHSLRPEDRAGRYRFSPPVADAPVGYRPHGGPGPELGDAPGPVSRPTRPGLETVSGPETLVAVDGDELIGFATVGDAPGEPAGTGELMALYVDPPAWGSGIGRGLIAAARARLVERGMDTGVLWVLAGNARAERFYRSDGWSDDGGRRTVEVWGVVVDELRYRRALP